MNVLKTDEYKYIRGVVKDTPENVIKSHAIKQKHGSVYYSGSLKTIEDIIVKVPYEDEDYVCFGKNPEILIKMLETIEGFDGILVDSDMEKIVLDHYRKTRNINLKSFRSISHVLEDMPDLRSEKAVIMGDKDTDLLNAASQYFDWYGFNSVQDMLIMGQIAGVVEDGKLVSVAYTSAFSNRYVDIGIRTKKEYRGRGYAFDSAVRLLNEIKAFKQTPVWNVMEDNYASLAVCRKLGFVEAGATHYLCE